MESDLKLVILQGDRDISVMTIHPTIAENFLIGGFFTAELGGYDPGGPFATHAMIKNKTIEE